MADNSRLGCQHPKEVACAKAVSEVPRKSLPLLAKSELSFCSRYTDLAECQGQLCEQRELWAKTDSGLPLAHTVRRSLKEKFPDGLSPKFHAIGLHQQEGHRKTEGLEEPGRRERRSVLHIPDVCRAVFTVHLLKRVCQVSLGHYTVKAQQIDSSLSSLATPNSSSKMSFQVISGANTIIVLAHADHKHRISVLLKREIGF